MDYTWFSRARTAGAAGPAWSWGGGTIANNIDTSTTILQADSFLFIPVPFSFQTETKIAYTSDNYTSFTQLSLPGLSSTNQFLVPIVRYTNNGTRFAFYNSENNPYYNGTVVVNLGLSYTNNFTTATQLTVNLPDLAAQYTPPAGTVISGYTGSTLAGYNPRQSTPLNSTPVNGFNMSNPDNTFFRTLYAVTSLGQSTPSSGLRNYIELSGHIFKVNNASGAVSWVRSGYRTGLTPVLQSIAGAAGMGRQSYPLDISLTLPSSPNEFTTPTAPAGSFPGTTAKLGNIIFFKPGSIRQLADITITNGGTGATKGGLASFSGFLVLTPPSDPTSDQRNNLPLVVRATVTAGVVTSVDLIACVGAGFNIGSALYQMSWDSQDAISNIVTGNTTLTPSATYTWTTLPQFTINFQNRAPIRYLTMNDYGDGYYWNGTTWNGVNTKQATYNATTRSYTSYVTLPTVPWTSASTGQSGTLPVIQSPPNGLNAQSLDFNYDGPGLTTATINAESQGGVYSPNPKSNLLVYRPPARVPWSVPNNPQSGIVSWATASANAWFYQVGQFVVSNDSLSTYQYVSLPGLSYQPLVPYKGLAPAFTAAQLLYTSVPETDPCRIVLLVNGTGNGDNMYVFALHAWGSYTAGTGGTYNYKIVMYHWQPGPNLNDVNTGATWTNMWESASFVRTLEANKPWWENWYQSGSTGGQLSLAWCNNSNYNLNTAPTEGWLSVSWRNLSNQTLYSNNYYFTLPSETSITQIPQPTGLTWTPAGVPVFAQFDYVNNRYVISTSNTGADAFPGMPPGPGLVLLNPGDSMFATNPTVTFVNENVIGDVWRS